VASTFGYPLIEPRAETRALTYTAELDRVSTADGARRCLGTSSAVSVFTRLPLANLFNDGFHVQHSARR